MCGAVEELFPVTASCSGNTQLMENSPISATGYLEKGVMVIWAMEMKKGQQITTATTGKDDIDLYLRWNDCPTKQVYDERGYTTGGSEKESFTAPADGTVFIGVRGYKTSDYTLKTTCNG